MSYFSYKTKDLIIPLIIFVCVIIGAYESITWLISNIDISIKAK